MLLRTAAALVALGLATLSCSDDDEPSASSALTTGATVTPPSGTGCPELPALAGAPAPDAIARLPELSTFADALTTTQYADVLRADGPFTVFAAVDAAFASVADRDALLADDERLTGVLAMHVIDEQRLSAADLATAGTVQALGGDLSITDEGGELRINEVASVVCADLQTANATVHLVDAVLFPPVAEEVVGGSQLYSVDLTTGAATSIGAIGTELGVLGLAFDPSGSSTVYGLTDAPELISFDPADPATVTSIPITNVAEGSTLVAVDGRPADGSLLAVSDASVLYAIDLATGEATPVGDGINPPLTDPGVGMDVDATTDRIRLSSATGENLLVDPTTGTVGVDPATEQPVVGAPLPRIVALASRQAGGATELFGIDAQAGTLAAIPSPDVGLVRSVGPLGITVTDGASFDIGPDGTALLVVPG